MARTIAVGDKLPLFTLPDQNGNSYSIKEIIGQRNLVLFFYPKDNTPVCTKEVCGFRDLYSTFADADTEVVGVSQDGVESHAAFANKHQLNFSILSDQKGELTALLGIPKRFGLLRGRYTMIVDKEGIVREVVNSYLNAEMHVKGALQTVRNFEEEA